MRAHPILGPIRHQIARLKRVQLAAIPQGHGSGKNRHSFLLVEDGGRANQSWSARPARQDRTFAESVRFVFGATGSMIADALVH